MSKSVPLTRRFPDDWCHRTRIWRPDKFRGQTHSSIQIEGPLHPDVGEFLETLHTHGRFVDEATIKKLRSVTRSLRSSAKKARQVEEVMES